MPAKISTDASVEKDNKTKVDKKSGKDPSAIYEKVTAKKVSLSPSAWTVFQDFLKRSRSTSKIKIDEAVAGETKKGRSNNDSDSKALVVKPKNTSFADNFKDFSKVKQNLLNPDIIWSGVAIGCVIGAVYFLFGGLQPLVLQNYIATADKTIDQIGETFVNQVNALSGAQNGIIQNTTYNILSDCKVEQKYTGLEEGVGKVDLAERSLYPNPSYKALAKFNGFAETEVRQAYEGFYAYYSQSLINLQNSVLNDIRDLPTYANYRNVWVDGCVIITNVDSSWTQVVDYCNQLQTNTEEYLKNKRPSFWGEVQKPIEDNIALCKQLTEGQGGNFVDWKLKWLSNYGSITAYIPNVQKNVERINNAIQDMKVESTKCKNKIDDIYERKTGLVGIWYFLEI